MTKHVIDTPKSHSSARLWRYVELEKRKRAQGPHPAVETLIRRERPLSAVARGKAFWKIGAAS